MGFMLELVHANRNRIFCTRWLTDFLALSVLKVCLKEEEGEG